MRIKATKLGQIKLNYKQLYNQRKEELTDKIPHPVGMKANIAANMSATDRSVNITATTKPANANKRERPCTKRNRSWKLTDIFWLNVKTY